MSTNDDNIRLLKRGEDLSKKFGIVDKIWKDPNASPDQKKQAVASVANDLGVSVPDFNNFDFDFDCAADSNADVPPPLPPLPPIDSTSVVGKENAPRKRKLDSLVNDQKEALVASRARFKSIEKAKKPHGNIRNKNALGFKHKHTAEAIEKNRKRGKEQFAAGNYLSIYHEERAAAGDILGQKLARIATKRIPKICKGTKDTQLVIRCFEKFMQAYYGMGNVSAFGTNAYKQMVDNLLGRLKGAGWELVEKPKVPANQAGKGDKFVFSHPNFILNDDSKLTTIVFQNGPPKGAGKGKNSRWSVQELSDLNKYAAMYKHPAGNTHAGKPDWKQVGKKLGRDSDACRFKFSSLKKYKLPRKRGKGEFAQLVSFSEPVQWQTTSIWVVVTAIKIFCQSCYQNTSTLEYSRTYDIIEPTENKANDNNSTTTLLWVHGGGGCRKMFLPHAKYLSKRGYRSILIYLPGHGTLVETKLTLDECVVTVQSILNKEFSNVISSSQKIIYIGGSLGAYIGFYILSKLNNKFASAVLIDCGQNVGPDCSLKARLGIWFLRKLSSKMSNKALMGAMMGAVKKSKADYHLVETTFGAGYFFQQGGAQCDCMHAVAPSQIIPDLDLPILFFNGSEDYRDSEDKWLELCRCKELSSLKVYDGGDHFFCHDTRFVHDMLDRIDTFVQATSCIDNT